MDKILEIYNLSKLNHEEMENLNRPITSMEIEGVIKNLPRNKKPRRVILHSDREAAKKENDLLEK